MADTSVAIKDANGLVVPIDTVTPAGGEPRQVTVLGDPDNLRTTKVNEANALLVNEPGTKQASRTVVAAIASADKQLLAANAARTGFTVWNRSSDVLYLGYGSTDTVTTANATVPIQPGDYFEDPFQWKGSLRGIWGAANGNAVVTELSA